MLYSARFDLTGRLALVTGASRGIGAALAFGLAEAGADIVLAARNAEALEHMAAKVRGIGRKAHVAPLDVAAPAAIEQTFAHLISDNLVPTILVNNAGTEEVTPSLEVTEPLWDRIVDTNLKGAFFVAPAPSRGTWADAPAALSTSARSVPKSAFLPPPPTPRRRAALLA